MGRRRSGAGSGWFDVYLQVLHLLLLHLGILVLGVTLYALIMVLLMFKIGG